MRPAMADRLCTSPLCSVLSVSPDPLLSTSTVAAATTASAPASTAAPAAHRCAGQRNAHAITTCAADCRHGIAGSRRPPNRA